MFDNISKKEDIDMSNLWFIAYVDFENEIGTVQIPVKPISRVYRKPNDPIERYKSAVEAHLNKQIKTIISFQKL